MWKQQALSTIKKKKFIYIQNLHWNLSSELKFKIKIQNSSSNFKLQIFIQNSNLNNQKYRY